MQTTPEPEPKPKRSRRMIVWLVAAPVVILLLALAGANWKTFHLAYCKHLMGSEDPAKQNKGARMIVDTHLRKGMTLEEVRAILAPARVTEIGFYVVRAQFAPYNPFMVSVEGNDTAVLGFDENDRLHSIVTPEKPSFPYILPPRK